MAINRVGVAHTGKCQLCDVCTGTAVLDCNLFDTGRAVPRWCLSAVLSVPHPRQVLYGTVPVVVMGINRAGVVHTSKCQLCDVCTGWNTDRGTAGNS
jgi:hypothetical protein